ncbi:MAG: T9SS type A sorting domain-containing protein [Flavipsychrobacter sp.]|nr:T9SS type A sorting domain-containing protein [Flavipsychrobacter sp.]
MKKQLLAALLLPVTALAQPTLSHVENYTIGTTLRFINCDPAAAGPAGANQTWNFGNLSSLNDTATVWVIAPPTTNNPFPGAEFVLQDDDSSYLYYDTSATEINMIGLVDSSTSNFGNMGYSNPMLIIPRPFTYMDNAADSFYNQGTFLGFSFTGAGGTMMEADAYGTLQLPHDTFTNVLRIKTYTEEEDMITGLGMLNTRIASYTWYIDSIPGALLRIDSMKFTGAYNDSSVDVQYYYNAQPTGLGEVKAHKLQAAAGITGNELVLSASFEQGRQYEAAVYSLNGQKVYSTAFPGASGTQRLTMGSDLAAGTYIITLRRKGDFRSQVVMKVVKP